MSNPTPFGPNSETQEDLRGMLKEIESWEKSQKDLWFWEKIGRLPFMLLDRLTPKVVQKKLGQAIDELGSFVQTGGQYLVSESSVLSKLRNEAVSEAAVRGPQPDLEDPLTLESASRLPIAVMNKTSEGLVQSRAAFATAQGATTGFGGIFTLAIDIPAILGLSLKMIQEIAITYGYDPKEKLERIFVIKCLQFASADIVGKKAVLEDLSDFGNENRQRDSLSQLQGWREVIASYRDNFGWKKLFQLVPIAGALFGAIINRGTLQDVAEAATMLYRKRRILERLRELEA
ncbi:EcsC family protein [Paenibacillus sp. YPG26]|uniref:EcsC family protein n=1 Tax=Paenibacillus sp. YPG26 TaxID=2878915 RepID=UPI002041BF79|nr:EcsC family protein [Paenibacillus sp. YPG26]USB32282.1 EcsC family protein [Paenibacillus sp. YPG26]